MDSSRSKRIAAVLGGTALAALCGAGPALASGVSNPIIIQPNPVAPGGTISVFDGGNCDFPATGTVTFQTGSVPGIPAITIGPLKSMIGGVGQVPANIAPGSYQVSLTCTTTNGNKKEGPFNGTLVVASGASSGKNPTGGAKTGDGASLTSPGGLAEGMALVGGGGAGWFLLRRRGTRSN